MKQLVYLIGKNFFIAIAFLVLYFSFIRTIYFITQGKFLVPIYFDRNTILGIIVSALSMALILGILHYLSVRKISQSQQFDLSPIQHRVLVLKSNSTNIFENCVVILQKFPARIIENNAMKNYITARTNMSWKSWGDNIRIDVIQVDDISTQVKITCRPSLKTTLVDFGINYKNAEKLLSLISEATPVA
jgi:hypothetical protein